MQVNTIALYLLSQWIDVVSNSALVFRTAVSDARSCAPDKGFRAFHSTAMLSLRRFVGERELPNKQPDELMNVSERIVKTTEASDICDGAKGSAAAVAADASGSSNGPTGEPVGTIAEEVIVEEVVIPAAAPT